MIRGPREMVLPPEAPQVQYSVLVTANAPASWPTRWKEGALLIERRPATLAPAPLWLHDGKLMI